jgi:tRNA(His) guanylyltransferase
MNKSAQAVCLQFTEIVLAYGQSDEYSFVLPPSSKMLNRRAFKLCSLIASYFTSCFVMNWKGPALEYPPSFDARTVCYPTFEVLLDYLRWRQADCHINNLYNTVFWAIVKSGITENEAHQRLKGTTSAQKNQILFEEFGINYNHQPEMFKKGSVLVKPSFQVTTADLFHREFYINAFIIES